MHTHGVFTVDFVFRFTPAKGKNLLSNDSAETVQVEENSSVFL